MIEKDVEGYLVRKIRAAGGRAYKWVSPGTAGVPDRIVLMPGGVIAFVETKRPKGQARALQKKRIRELRSLGFTACVVDTREGVDVLIHCLREGGTQHAVCAVQLSGVLYPEDS